MISKGKVTKKRINYQGGQAVIISVVLLMGIGFGLVQRSAGVVLSDASAARSTYESKRAQIHAEAGTEDLTWRIRQARTYGTTEVIKLDDAWATSTILANSTSNLKYVSATGTSASLVRSASVSLRKGERVTFNYALQAGNGGFSMSNSSSVVGNIYANGSVVGAGNLVKGSVVSAGATGLIDDIHATSSAFAHTIQNSNIDRDAYYQVKTNTTVSGTSYPGSTDKPTSTFPISDATIDEWKAVAEEGGVHTSPCPYSITSTVTIGPKKINCSLSISNGARVTVAGMLWVVGDITFGNSSGIYLDPALGNNSVAMIADNPSSRSTGSKIAINNSTTFYNTGTPGSFLFLISANNSAELGGSTTAIDIGNSATGPIFLYTNHGKIAIGNSSVLKAVTGYLISMRNSAQLVYDDGLESTIFDTGPGGSWNLESWKEGQ